MTIEHGTPTWRPVGDHTMTAETQTLEILLAINAILRDHRATIRRCKDGLYLDQVFENQDTGLVSRKMTKLGNFPDWTVVLPRQVLPRKGVLLSAGIQRKPL